MVAKFKFKFGAFEARKKEGLGLLYRNFLFKSEISSLPFLLGRKELPHFSSVQNPFRSVVHFTSLHQRTPKPNESRELGSTFIVRNWRHLLQPITECQMQTHQCQTFQNDENSHFQIFLSALFALWCYIFLSNTNFTLLPHSYRISAGLGVLCENHNLITIRAFKPFFHAQIPVCLKRLFFLSEDVLLAISPPPKHWPLLRNEKRIIAFTHKLYLQKATVVDFYIAYVIISPDEVRRD